MQYRLVSHLNNTQLPYHGNNKTIHSGNNSKSFKFDPTLYSHHIGTAPCRVCQGQYCNSIQGLDIQLHGMLKKYTSQYSLGFDHYQLYLFFFNIRINNPTFCIVFKTSAPNHLFFTGL